MKRLLYVCILFLSLFLCVSCGPQEGWGVVLWDSSKHSITVGSLVPVQIISKINKSYIVTDPTTGNNAEIPFPELRLFNSKKDALAFQKEFSPYVNTYARVKRDGLVIRDKPDSTANDIYRLKLDEIVKIIIKTDGAMVSNDGVTALKGDWYQVLSDAGTFGYVFSNQLDMYDKTKPIIEKVKSTELDKINTIFTDVWYPEYYKTMISQNQFDLDKFSYKYGIFADPVNKIVNIEMPENSMTIKYTAIKNLDNDTYVFEGSSLVIQVNFNGTLLVKYEDIYKQLNSLVMVRIGEDLQTIIKNEQNRRQKMLDAILAKSTEYTSENAGTLSFKKIMRFNWSGHENLDSKFISESAGEAGTISFNVYPGKSISSDYTGAFILYFDSMSANDGLTYLYTLTNSGIKLEAIPKANIKGIEIVKNSDNIIEFSK